MRPPGPPPRRAGSLGDGRRVSEYPTLRCSASRRHGRHVVAARYDLIANGVLSDPCIFITNNTQSNDDCNGAPTGTPSGSGGPTDGPEDSAAPTDSGPPPQGSALAPASIPPWDGTE